MRIVRFELRAVLISVLACALVLATFPVTAPTARAAVPRVVIIVGPAGPATDGYRADARKAASEARAAGADVETIYSPDATWSRVRPALQGASLVVYMGHGNGFPSIYRKTLWPKSQDGLGLNPTAGGDDDAHQYFGEGYLARDVRLAPHAVVLLHHLCYASGNSEPGMREGDLATAKQRVDNYAAGWLAAGADAVVAEAAGGPAYYVRRILAGQGTIESIWRSAPTAHGHVLAFASERTPGLTALMDPTRPLSGFWRSLVGRAKLRADEVARGAGLVAPHDVAGSPTPRLGPTVDAVTLDGVPTAGSPVTLKLTLADAGTEVTSRLGIGIRWDPLALDPPSVVAAAPSASPAASAPAGTAPVKPAAAATPPGAAAATPSAAATLPGAAAADEPLASAPPIVLISPEVPGAVVTLSDAKVTRSGVSADLATPLEPGLYRLVVSVHDGDGVAFDAKTQERIPALIVRVTGELSALFAATDRLEVAAGAMVDLPVMIANTGHLAWAVEGPVAIGARRVVDQAPGQWSSVLVGHWLRLDSEEKTSEAVAARATIHVEPGKTEQVSLALEAPAIPGTYLLVLDVVSPLYGSLTAAGGSPVVVRVNVGPPQTSPPRVRGLRRGGVGDSAQAVGGM